MDLSEHYDVVIIGAGLAGLSIARQLLLASDKTGSYRMHPLLLQS